MIHAIIRHGARLLAGAAFVACVAPAHGAGITLSDSNCDSFSLTGTPGNQTLTCVVSNAPSCTISGPSSATLGTAVTLTAVCSSSPTSWQWSSSTQRLNCGSTPTCADTQTVAGAVTYTVTAVNAIASGSASQTVTWSAQQIAAPSGCSISASPSASLAAGGGAVTLTLNCTGGGAPSSYSWSGGFAANATSAQVSGTVTATQTFTATASNAGGTSSAATLTVNVATGGGSTGSCPGFTNTRVLQMDWNNPQPLLTGSIGGVGPSDAVVVKFTTGPNVNPNQYGNIAGAEYTSDPSTRQAALSTQMCDFGSTLGFGATSTSNTVTINFSVGANSSGYYPALQPNTTYYYNVKQLAGSTCASSGNCAMYFQLHKPPGL